ncbi:DUF2034 domain-containing protein [Paenibacillus sp. FSL R7-0312]|uniref:DUF2034 domain-containing protein n=1 Tax=Paenibacillus sp. FSL R7-0312 TaxID=2921682 RepID=UPI0030F4DAEB
MKIKKSIDKFNIAKIQAGGKKDDIAKYYLDSELAGNIAQYASLEVFKLMHEKSKLANEEISVPPTFEDYGISANYFKRIGIFMGISSFLGGITGLLLFAYGWYLLDISSDEVWSGLLISICGPGAILAIPISAFFRSCYVTFSSRVKKCSKYCQAIRSFSKNKMDFWQNLSWQEFEKEVSNIFSREGFVARVTKATGDKGVDIIMHHNNHKIIVQCKQYKKPVGPAIVRELIGTVYSQRASLGILIALTGYTQGSYDAANEGPILLWDISDLLQLNKEYIEQIFADNDVM